MHDASSSIEHRRRQFTARDSLAKVVLGPKTLLEKGLYEINEQRVNKIVLFSSSETLRIPYIKDFHKTIENKVYQVFDQWSNDIEEVENALTSMIEDMQADCVLVVGKAFMTNIAKLIVVPTTIAAGELTNIIHGMRNAPVLVARNDIVKPVLVIYDTHLFSTILTRGEAIKGTFLLMAHLTDQLYDPAISPLSLMAAREAIHICVKLLLRWAQEKTEKTTVVNEAISDRVVDDLLYATYLCGECWQRERTHLHHFMVDILHARHGIPYDECHLAIHAYSAWYNQDRLLIAVLEELGTCHPSTFIYDMQYLLLPERISLLLLGMGVTSIPTFINTLLSSKVDNPVPLQLERLSTILSLAIVGARPPCTTEASMIAQQNDQPAFQTLTSTAIVLDRYQTCQDYRLKEILTRVVQHLHAVAREVDLTVEEWAAGVNFLSRVGLRCSKERQEMVMLSDMLGLEALVEDIQYRLNLEEKWEARKEGEVRLDVTPGSLLGPFHLSDSTVLDNGSELFDKKRSSDQHVYLFQGRVLSDSGHPVAGAVLDVWHCDDQGHYDVQRNFSAELSHLGFRAKFVTDEDGTWSFRTLPVKSYTLPTDGPVGELARALQQHTNLPAHVHFLVVARGHRPLNTHLYPHPDDPFLTDDAGFGHKEELIKTGEAEGDHIVFKQDFILHKDSHYNNLDPLHYTPAASAELFFA
eukprot:scaffold7957_cov129-Ochromonas_danica.AAC.2